MLVRGENGEYKSIDFRETAPAAAYEDMFEGNSMGSIMGGLASGIPGELRGLEYLHQMYGKLPWVKVVMPAAKLAERGFIVNEDLRKAMNSEFFSKRNFLVEDAAWAEDFAPNGTLLELGDIITRKRYAKTLDTIAREGVQSFYEGEMADAMVRAVQADNGTITLEDLATYNISIRPVISIDYRGRKLHSMSSPSSGAVTLSTLKTIEGYEPGYPESNHLDTHRLDEAIKFAYAAHNELGDPEFVDGVDAFEAAMLNETYAADIRSKISDKHVLNTSDYNPKNLSIPPSHGTSHIVTADASGLSISLTTTVNLFFGSQLMVPETGVIMNNEMNDFSLPHVSNAFGYVPSPNNFIRAGKRPLSSCTPVIVENADGSFYMATGAAGGSRIITATIQALWHVLEHDMTMPEALAQPRMHDQLLPAQVVFEETFDNRTTDYMRRRGHNVTWTNQVLSSVQGIRRLENGTFEAAGEPRQKNSGGFSL